MEIARFDPNIHSLDKVADLVMRAYSEGAHDIPHDEKSKKIARELILAGNNFLGRENIYLCIREGTIAGLVIGYTGKRESKIKALFDYLVKFRLTQMLNYLLISSQLFDSGFTPHLKEDEFYISVLVVEEKHRNQGIGTFLLNQAVQIAGQQGCNRLILDVDNDNMVAKALYEKFGFNIRSQTNSVSATQRVSTMEYRMGT